MKKRITSLLLIVATLLSMVPALALPALAASTEETVTSSFVKDHQVEVTADPMTYRAWAEANSGLDSTAETYEDDLAAYMATTGAQEAFQAYLLTQGQVIWSGDWTIGNIHNTTGAYEPVAYHTFFEGASWSAWPASTWYTTKTAQLNFLKKFFAQASNSLWYLENVAYYSDLTQVNRVCLSTTDKAYASYTYTVPAGKSGMAILTLLDSDMAVSGTTRLCVMKNDQIIWPEGASISDATGWATGFYNNTDVIARMSELSVDVEAGDKIHFVVAGIKASAARNKKFSTMIR